MAKTPVKPELGFLGRDIVTGFEGMIVSKHDYLHGCTRFAIEPTKLNKDGRPIEPCVFDEARIEVTKAKRPSNLPLVFRLDPDISLGSEVKDSITGFSGIAAGNHVYISGERQITIEPTKLKEGDKRDDLIVTAGRIEIVRPKPVPMADHAKHSPPPLGGPQKDVVRSSRRV